MGKVSLTGSDIIVLGGRVLTAFADGDYGHIEFDGDLANMKVSKDGNIIYAFNQTGRMAKLTLRLLRGSADDIQLNSWKQSMITDFSGFTLLAGSFTKRIGDGLGAVRNDVYQMASGVFKKEPGAKSNAEGDTEQSVVIYELLMFNQGRVIQ